MDIDYDRDIEIDESALDVEWLEQPRLMRKYSRYSAKMQKNADLAEEALSVAKAEADKEIRTNPSEFLGDVSPTADAVKNAIAAHPKVRKAVLTHIKAKYDANVAKGAVTAFDHRKHSLENLVRLHGQQYFAGPAIPRELDKEWEKRNAQRRANEAVSDGMKREK